MARLHLTTPQINRLRSLLHMWYSPSELADEIGVSVQWVRRKALVAGCPYRRDETGHVWIDGQAFSAWARLAIKHARAPMGPNQAWCVKCRQPVHIVGDLYKTSVGGNRNIEILHGTCAACGGKVARTGMKTDHGKP